MLVAVNRKNKELIPTDGKWVCNQGKLLLEIDKNPALEVLVDEELPGSLRTEDLVEIIRKKYPQVQLSLINNHKETIVLKKQNPLPFLGVSIGTGLLVIALFLLFSKDFSGNSLYVKNLYLSVGIAMLVNFCISYIFLKGDGKNKD